MIDDSFYLKVAHALSGCRLVEQDLKLYITEVFDLARKRIAAYFPSNWVTRIRRWKSY